MDRSEAVGLRDCPGNEFGGWNATATPFRLGLELGVTQLHIDDLSVPFQSEHWDNRYEIRFDELSDRAAIELRPRFSIFLHRNLYVGMAGSIGVTARSAAQTSVPIRARVNSIITVGARAFVGVSAAVGRRWQFNGEVAAGIRAMILNIETREGECINTLTESFRDLKVEGRVGFDRFVSPMFSIGGFAGYDPLQREATFGLRLAAHGRSYDAQRRAEPTNR